MYNKVIITDVFKRGFIYECNTEQDFKEYIEKNNDACESIGKKGQFIKPIFDIDAYGTDINIDDVKNDINQLYPNKTINYAKREPRNDEKKCVVCVCVCVCLCLKFRMMCVCVYMSVCLSVSLSL